MNYFQLFDVQKIKRIYLSEDIVSMLIMLPLFSVSTVNSLLHSVFGSVFSAAKDTYYRFKNNADTNWRNILLNFEKRSNAVNFAIKLIVENMIKHELYIFVPGNRKEWQSIKKHSPKSSELPKKQTIKNWATEERIQFMDSKGIGELQPKQGWLKFGFPLHYNSDILEAMYALAILDTPMNSKLKKPLQIIKEKRTPDGKWIMKNSLNGKMLTDVEEKGKPSKWLTYFAYYVLNHFDS